MSEPKRVLYVNSEIYPYLPESEIAISGRYLPQGIQESGKEIRSFMPRYGLINERRNQLHEVIRLSGMNIVIDDIDHPLSIKVASISAARMQVYFIETEDYFHRKALYKDDAGNYFEDNDQRAIFFARGVLETVKKLRWKPDIIHCQGWISHLIPIYLKRVYNDDPIFADAKVVLSLFNECPDITFSENFKEHILHSNISNEDKAPISTATPNGTNLAQLAINYSDGVIIGNSSVEPELEKYAQDKGIVVISSPTIGIEETEYIKTYNSLYDQILED